jgi:uncharacterized lipoprotein NlpE involved in copper resistance
MKQLIIALVLGITLVISGCEGRPIKKKRYVIEVTYFEGQKDTLSYIGIGSNRFSLEDGDLKTERNTKTLLSGIRQFEVLRVDSVGTIDRKEINKYLELKLEKKEAHDENF